MDEGEYGAATHAAGMAMMRVRVSHGAAGMAGMRVSMVQLLMLQACRG